jgi:starch synthase
MYSLRYGTVPIVRRTGGLADTVIPVDTATNSGTGFVFDDYSAAALGAALEAAMLLYAAPADWRALMLRGMREDFSWQAQGRLYEDFYRRMLAPQ